MVKKILILKKKILKKNKSIKIYYVSYKPKNIEEFKNQKVIAFAGIGNPENFFDLLKGNNINLIEKIKFPDHYNYSENEIKSLLEKSKNKSAVLVTTEKDYFRINEEYKNMIKYIIIKVEIENRNEFIEEIKKIIWKL